MLNWRAMHERAADRPPYRIDPLGGDEDLDGVLAVEAESFTNPWTRAMYAWELQNRSVCHIYVVRTHEVPVAGFCAFWLVVDEIHLNNVAILPQFRGRGIGTACCGTSFCEAGCLGEAATLEVRPQTRAPGGYTSGSGSRACHQTELDTNPVEMP